MTNRSLPLLLAACLGGLAACAADAPPAGTTDPGGSNTPPGDGSGSVPLTAEGKYQLASTYDIATNMPGTAGAVINGFISATDDPDDPTRYILDQLINQLPSGTFKNIVQGSESFVAGYLNDRLLSVAPEFVTRILDIGDKFGQVAKHFGTIDTLEIAANGTAIHTVTGVHFKVDTEELDFLFKDYGIADVKVTGVAVTLDATGKLTIADHKVPLPYGALLHLAVDNVIIPMIDPVAVDLSDVFHDAVDCTNVGQYVYDAVGIGSPSTYEAACNAGLSFAASAIYQQIDHIDGAAFEFGINGTAKAIDKNHDGKADVIQTGKWGGTLSYAGTPAPLANATFTGTRL
ncbi:MAG: hypothetical protein JO257_28590 [Deltaproteobacteria bacterium]|nr:hypothetical protein [Deltaproteobacteria bacterium]